MDKTATRDHAIMDDNAEPRYFHGSLDTSDYVPDWEAINASLEKNRAIVASLGGEFAELVRPKQRA